MGLPATNGHSGVPPEDLGGTAPQLTVCGDESLPHLIEEGAHQPLTGTSDVPREKIVDWILALHDEVAQEALALRDKRPNLFSHPVDRFRYIGSMALLAGKREVLNRFAEWIGSNEDAN